MHAVLLKHLLIVMVDACMLVVLVEYTAGPVHRVLLVEISSWYCARPTVSHLSWSNRRWSGGNCRGGNLGDQGIQVNGKVAVSQADQK